MSSNECVLDANEKEIEYLEYLEQENAAPVTISGYRWIIRAATSGLRDAGMEWEPERWTRNEVNYVRNVIFGKQKNGVRRRHLSVLNKYLQWYDNKVIQEMKIKWPSDEEMPTEHLLPLQALAVLDAARGVERIVVHLELNMGLRRVEVLLPETKELQGHRPGGPREGPGRREVAERTLPLRYAGRAEVLQLPEGERDCQGKGEKSAGQGPRRPAHLREERGAVPVPEDRIGQHGQGRVGACRAPVQQSYAEAYLREDIMGHEQIETRFLSDRDHSRTDGPRGHQDHHKVSGHKPGRHDLGHVGAERVPDDAQARTKPFTMFGREWTERDFCLKILLDRAIFPINYGAVI